MEVQTSGGEGTEAKGTTPLGVPVTAELWARHDSMPPKGEEAWCPTPQRPLLPDTRTTRFE